MFERIWDFFVDALIALFIPLVCSYYTLSSNVFLNVSARDSKGLEWLGNILLTPVQYIFAGEEAIQMSDGCWEFAQKFDYENVFWLKTTMSLFAFPPSIVLGSAIKGLGFFDESIRMRHLSMVASLNSTEVKLNDCKYREIGLQVGKLDEFLIHQGHLRKTGDEKVFEVEKRALRDIARVFNEAGIFWWVDCGTCLGAYRYGGVIPWDEDIDIAVLLPDFKNVRAALNRLDKDKYLVQNWSSRSHPNSYFKLYIRESATLIDIYHFEILPETKELRYILSLEDHLFFPEWWKVRERRFKAPVSFDAVFPLKKAMFDGVEVYVPNDVEKYLQRYYGENLSPAKVFNSKTGCYEKDLSHPYWERAYAH